MNREGIPLEFASSCGQCFLFTVAGDSRCHSFTYVLGSFDYIGWRLTSFDLMEGAAGGMNE